MFSVSLKMLFFPSHFLNDIYKCLNVTSGDEFFLQKIWASKTQWWPIDMKNKKKKKHLKYGSFFGERYEKQRNWVWKMYAFRLVNIVAFAALVLLNNLYNNRFFNAYSKGYLSLTLCFIDTMVITDWTLNLRSSYN